MLLHSYLIRKKQFRNSRIKKITLWREISEVFKKKKLNKTADALSRKFGNMKSTYASKKKNNSKKTTGAGRKSWPWLKAMDEIFHDDISINFKQDAVTSMPTDGIDGVLNLTKSSSGYGTKII